MGRCRETRESLGQVLTTANKILLPLAALLAWVGGIVYLGWRAGLWEPNLTSGTVLWFVTTGLVLFGNFNEVSEEENYFRRKALATLELSGR